MYRPFRSELRTTWWRAAKRFLCSRSNRMLPSCHVPLDKALTHHHGFHAPNSAVMHLGGSPMKSWLVVEPLIWNIVMGDHHPKYGWKTHKHLRPPTDEESIGEMSRNWLKVFFRTPVQGRTQLWYLGCDKSSTCSIFGTIPSIGVSRSLCPLKIRDEKG
jgi:hypothetical protein